LSGLTTRRRPAHIARRLGLRMAVPVSTFTYIPIIPHFVAFFKNSDMVKAMNYCGTYESDPAVMKDVFDSENYKKLKKEYATIEGKQFSHKFFSDL
jgi:hypothetical protein